MNNRKQYAIKKQKIDYQIIFVFASLNSNFSDRIGSNAKVTGLSKLDNSDIFVNFLLITYNKCFFACF